MNSFVNGDCETCFAQQTIGHSIVISPISVHVICCEDTIFY